VEGVSLTNQTVPLIDLQTRQKYHKTKTTCRAVSNLSTSDEG